jgi:hypothetical protein
MSDGTELKRRETVSEIVAHYHRIVRDTRAGYRLLRRGEARLREHIYEYGRLKSGNHYDTFDVETEDRVVDQLKKDTWRGIMHKLNVRGVMDSTKRKELDTQLETGVGLPDINEEAILKVVVGMVSQFGDFQKEVVKEAFNLIRHKSDGYKSTDQMFKIGEKAVLGWMVEKCWGKDGRYRVAYRAEDTARTVETAFRLLDGKGPLKQNCAEFAGVLNSSPNGEGQTEYFRFRSFKNGNLHLWFLRPDLVTEMNAIAGGEKALNR